MKKYSFFPTTFYALIAGALLALTSCGTSSELVDEWSPGNETVVIVSGRVQGLCQVIDKETSVVIAEHGGGHLAGGREGSAFSQDSVSRRPAAQAVASFQDKGGQWHALQNCLVAPNAKRDERITFVPVLMPNQMVHNGWWLVDSRIIGDTPNVRVWQSKQGSAPQKPSYNKRDYTHEKNNP